MKEAITKLLKIKSIVTVLLTLTFIVALYQQMKEQPLPDPLVNIYLMIIGFYFGSQVDKRESEANKNESAE